MDPRNLKALQYHYQLVHFPLWVMHLCGYVWDSLVCFLAGNSASQAIELLTRKGVPESRIIFLNLISVS